MNQPHEALHGSWKSPITSELIVSKAVGLGQIHLDEGSIYWVETRPSEDGRSVIVQRSAEGELLDRTPPEFNVRTRVHEYGGGAYSVKNGILYFANFADQRLYGQAPDTDPTAITMEDGMRYADGVVDSAFERLLCVREDHTGGGLHPVNTLVGIPLRDRGRAQILCSGNDFYSSPRLSPDGSRLAWLTWNHPRMPWDGTELWVAEFATDGSLAQLQLIAGNATESIFQPEWSPDGILYFVSDRSGWWNLYRWTGAEVEALWLKEAEFGKPQWVFGMSTYAFESAERIVCSYSTGGFWQLAVVNTRSRETRPLDLPFTDISSVRAARGHLVFCGASPAQAPAIVDYEFDNERLTVLRESAPSQVGSGYLATPLPVDFPTRDGGMAHGFFYPPASCDFVASSGERPPLLVMSHGGPTAAATNRLKLETQFWTSRGFAVLDVNYGGSTGYGRAYRLRLQGEWGVVDVDDCVSGALFMAQSGKVDGDRLAIRGSSAGGYTTLCALTFKTAFRAGASYYGVSDLETLAQDTHKFESHYMDSLIGAYPQRRDLYQARSPIHAAEQLSCPVIFFQGLEDRVVPPAQAEIMVGVLRAKKLPVAYVSFPDEQHGFRKADSIKRALDAELYFYGRIFGFEPADPLQPVEIENLRP